MFFMLWLGVQFHESGNFIFSSNSKDTVNVIVINSIWIWSMHLFCTHGTTFSHILTLMHFRDLQHHSDSFNTFTFSDSEIFCIHVHHLQMFYHISKYSTSFTHALHVSRTFAKPLDTNSVNFTAFVML